MALILVLAGLSVLTNRQEQHVLTGTVREYAGESITIVNEQTDVAGLTARLRNPRYEGRRIAVGANVTIWYRMIGESRPVADRVRVN